jgi:hypothetical protein
MLRPRPVLGRRASTLAAALSLASSRSPIEAEHFSLALKETGLEDPIKRAVPLYQFCGALWPNPCSGGQFVGWIAAKRDEIRDLLRVNPIPLPDLIGPDARDFAAPHWVKDCRTWRGKLKRIPITARHHCGTTSAFFGSDRGGEKVICFEPCGFGVRKPNGGDELGQEV